MNVLVDLVVDRGLLPEPVLRLLVRGLLRRRRRQITRGSLEERDARRRALREELSRGPVAVATQAANDQHYMVPTAFFVHMLGPRLKYSSAWWPPGVTSLAEAEERMLELTCQRALLSDGQRIMDLGCGWGSFALYAAERYPSSTIVAISNSASQREHIEDRARTLGLDNLTAVTADIGDLVRSSPGHDAHPALTGGFDRVVSVEMFEHVRNHRALTDAIATWLRPGGALFVHVFAHRSESYLFESGTTGDWMARHFFTGGMMPAADLLPSTVRSLVLDEQWMLSGRHYARTLCAWLEALADHRSAVLGILAQSAGPRHAWASLRRWRLFTIACEELFAARGGDEWHVAHYRFVRPPAADG